MINSFPVTVFRAIQFLALVTLILSPSFSGSSSVLIQKLAFWCCSYRWIVSGANALLVWLSPFSAETNTLL